MIKTANNSKDKEQWDKFLLDLNGSATKAIHHSFCWEWRDIIEKSFGHKPYYLIKEDKGILPCFLVNGALFGKALISMPYLNSGGLLARDEETKNELLEHAKTLSKDLGAKYFEFRFDKEQPSLEKLKSKSHKVSCILSLPNEAEELFKKFKPKLRSQIRRPTKSGVTAKVTVGNKVTSKEINGFYSVFSEHMRDLGTPVFPKKLFELTLKNFGENSKLITCWLEDKCIAGGLTIKHGNNVEIPWASSLRKFNKQSPNMMMYWEAIKTACDDGAQYFDFGRATPDTGSHKFKLQWGSDTNPLHWYYIGKDIPDISPNNPKFEMMIKCWQKMPIWSTKLIGPWITRSLP